MSRSDLSHHPINLSFATEGKGLSLALWMEAENQLPSNSSTSSEGVVSLSTTNRMLWYFFKKTSVIALCCLKNKSLLLLKNSLHAPCCPRRSVGRRWISVGKLWDVPWTGIPQLFHTLGLPGTASRNPRAVHTESGTTQCAFLSSLPLT